MRYEVTLYKESNAVYSRATFPSILQAYTYIAEREKYLTSAVVFDTKTQREYTLAPDKAGNWGSVTQQEMSK